ncbi:MULTISPECIES: hypothetical protein [unclassified Microcoleus]|uniref:hypothetical protein n=1 Tax=unclassified Microcoleus TaxID=2642155 RepID=UPI002FD1C1C5
MPTCLAMAASASTIEGGGLLTLEQEEAKHPFGQQASAVTCIPGCSPSRSTTSRTTPSKNEIVPLSHT